MIDFSKLPRTKEVTYTIIRSRYIGKVQRALQLAGETDWITRRCRVNDKSMLDDIKEHLPDWFDARYIVLISHFRPEDIIHAMDDIVNDKDVKAVLEEERRMAYDEYLHNAAYLDTLHQ